MVHVFTFGQVGTLVIVTSQYPVSRLEALTECCVYTDGIVSTPMVLSGVWLVGILSLLGVADVPSVDGRRGTSRCVCCVVYTHDLTVLHFECCGHYDRPLLGVDTTRRFLNQKKKTMSYASVA